MKKRDKELLTIHQAVENLSILSEINLESPSAIGIMGEDIFISERDLVADAKVMWLTPANAEDAGQALIRTYITIYEYLEEVNVSKNFDWSSPRSRRGLQEIMELAGLCADQMDSYLDSIKSQIDCPRIKQSKEYRRLQSYYISHIEKRFSVPLEGDLQWEADWKKDKDYSLLDMEKRGLKDFETVKNDSEYELFYLKNEDGHPFFQRSLLKNIELTTDFDEVKELKGVEDPLLRIRSFIDRNHQALSDHIIKKIYPLLEEFYEQKPNKEASLLLNKVIMALLLTANPQNLIQSTDGKCCLEYFNDFQYFLRKFLDSDAYRHVVDKSDLELINDITYSICQTFFNSYCAVRQEIIGFILRQVRLGEGIDNKEKTKQTDSIWSQLICHDENYRKILKCFPNGPLFKVMDVIRDENRKKGFSPIHQGNLPSRLYEFEVANKKMEVLKIPSPTRQEKVSDCHIVDEFKIFLSGLNKKKHLMILLQDRTSWKEHARCAKLEQLSKHKNFSKNLLLITLPKDTDFYYQKGHYEKFDEAKDFIEIFVEQLKSPEDFGFYFPDSLDNKEFYDFLDKGVALVHKLFFQKVSKLSRKNRQDFIEIFYHLLIIKVIEIMEPDSISFTCKDGIDIGAAFSSSFFSFIRLLENNKLQKQDKDMVLFLLYSEALLVRERSIDSRRVNRFLSAFSLIDELLNSKAIQGLSALYHSGTLKSFRIKKPS